MSELEVLKSTCKEKQELVSKLNAAFCKKIILRDIEQLQKQNSALIRQSESKYILDKLIITISQESLLNIEDRRGSAFLWGFEIQHNQGLRIGDAFTYKDNIFSVSILRENSNPELLEEVKKVIAQFDESIAFLKTEIPLDTWQYEYYDCHEEITCTTLDDVFHTVLNRDF